MADSLFSSPPRTAAELMRQLGFKFPAATAAAPALPPAETARAVETRPAPPRRTLHVTNGDVAAEGLRAAGLGGAARRRGGHRRPAP